MLRISSFSTSCGVFTDNTRSVNCAHNRSEPRSGWSSTRTSTASPPTSSSSARATRRVRMHIFHIVTFFYIQQAHFNASSLHALCQAYGTVLFLSVRLIGQIWFTGIWWHWIPVNPSLTAKFSVKVSSVFLNFWWFCVAI